MSKCVGWICHNCFPFNKIAFWVRVQGETCNRILLFVPYFLSIYQLLSPILVGLERFIRVLSSCYPNMIKGDRCLIIPHATEGPSVLSVCPPHITHRPQSTDPQKLIHCIVRTGLCAVGHNWIELYNKRPLFPVGLFSLMCISCGTFMIPFVYINLPKS